MSAPSPRFKHYVENVLARGLIFVAQLFPYPARVSGFGWLVSRIIAPIIGWNQRVRDNLKFIYPDMEAAEVRRITRGVTDNAGRSLIETWSPDEFVARNSASPISGPGLEAFETARASGRPVLLITGHFGNYLAVSVALSGRGHELGALYKPMGNPIFNEVYVDALRSFSAELFATNRRGLTNLIRWLRDGNIVGMLLDVHRGAGLPLPFLGKPAMTATSAAEWARKYDALLVPIFAIRQPDGLSFEIYVDEPVSAGNDAEITQSLNDSLSRQVERKPEQWFWIHRRWKTLPDVN